MQITRSDTGSLRSKVVFRKGVPGNPAGRPKKTADFDTELLRESDSPITIKDNGRTRRISKFRGIVMQLHNKALGGDIRASRLILDYRRQAGERKATSEEEQIRELQRFNDPDQLTDEELRWIAAGNDPKELLKRRTVEKRRKNGKEN